MQRLSSVVKEKVEAYVVSGVQEERKIELLDNLSIAVEKVQNKFENPIHNKAVKDGKEVENLCSCLEDVFQHGLKEKVFQNSSKSSDNLSFWAVVQKLSMKEDIQSIYRLSIIQTDVNRCRAWIRMKLKDHTIGSYIGLLTENSKLLKEFYNTNAFLRDAVKTESVRTLLQYVIASLDFYINVESPRQNFDQNSFCPVASPVVSSPDIDVTHVDFQHGEIVSRRRSSKKRARTPLAIIVPIRENDGTSSFSSDHSSGRSSRGSSTTSPIVEPINEISQAKVKLLEGNSLLREKPSAFLNPKIEHTTQRTRARGSSTEGEVQPGDVKKETDYFSSGSKRSESSGSERLSSPSSNEPAGDIGESSGEVSLTQKSRLDNQSLNSSNRTGDTESKSNIDELISPMKTSSQFKNMLTAEQKDEIANMITDLKLKSNRPLTTEKILDIIPIPEGMTGDEVKSYLVKCLKDYFTLGIITTRKSGQNSITSPLRKSLGKDCPVDSESQVKNVSSQIKLGNDLERKKSLDEFIRRGRTEPPYWSSVASDVKGTDISSRTSENKIVDCVAAAANDHNETVENSTETADTLRNEVERVALESNMAEESAALSNGNLESKDNSKNKFKVECGEDRLFEEDLNAKSQFDASSNNIENEIARANEGFLTDERLLSNANESELIRSGNSDGKVLQGRDVIEEKSGFFPEKTKSNSVLGEEEPSSSKDKNDKNSRNKNDVRNVEESTSDNALSEFNMEDGIKGDRFNDSSTIEDPNEVNYVPGICEDISPSKHSEAKPIKKLRKANTIGPGIARKSVSPRTTSTKSLERDSYGRWRSKNSSSGETNELLYGFRMNSPSLAESTTSSIDTNQGYLFDDDDYVTDSEVETCTSGENSEKEKIRSILADLGVNDDIIGMKEDHFSTPDSFMGFTTDEELENAIDTCKDRIQSLQMESEERKHLVKKLVQLRLKRHEQRETPAEDVVHVKKILGHQFTKAGKVPGNYLCDSCGSTIWALVHTLYKCQDCSFHCHRKCLKSVDKPCVSRKISGSVYITDITPENGLATQQYRCADCRRRLTYRDGYFQTRLCNYTGQYYCSNCHWNEAQIIPARVVHNWDFSQRKVSRQSKHLLNLLSSKPIIALKDLNPALFNFVEDLRDVRALREQVLQMKKYLVSCRIAIEERLLLLLKDRQHFVENADMYTMQDLVSVNNGKLLESLSGLTAIFGKHIKFDCLICQGRGFICEMCPSTDVIFPFDFNSAACPDCRSLFHRSCFRKGSCPKCKRKEARKALSDRNEYR